MNTKEDDSLLLSDEVARLLRVSESWLAKSRLNGTGPEFIKMGRTVRYTRSAILKFIRTRQRISTIED